jgi:hypothetical protein
MIRCHSGARVPRHALEATKLTKHILTHLACTCDCKQSEGKLAPYTLQCSAGWQPRLLQQTPLPNNKTSALTAIWGSSESKHTSSKLACNTRHTTCTQYLQPRCVAAHCNIKEYPSTKQERVQNALVMPHGELQQSCQHIRLFNASLAAHACCCCCCALLMAPATLARCCCCRLRCCC